MVDFHTHLLPGIDDGSPDTATSVRMLESLHQQGIDRVVATPHFYLMRDDIESFLKRRLDSAESLAAVVKNRQDIPRVALGAEVLIYPEIGTIEDIEALCIEGTNYMLVEMPMDRWTSVIYDVLNKLRTRRIIPIIAHIERYMKLQKDKQVVYRLIDLGCIIQANSRFFISAKTRCRAVKMVRDDAIQLIGSDCHDMARRKPDIAGAYEIIEKKLGKYGMEGIDCVTDMVLQDAIYRI